MGAKSTKRIFIAIAVVLSLLVLVPFAILFYLRTDSGSRQLLAIAKDKLKSDYGIDLHYKEGSIDLFRGFRFANLSIKGTREENRIDVSVATIALDYDFSLLAKSFTIKRFVVEDAFVKAKVIARSAAEAEPSASAVGFENFEHLLLDPPGSVFVEEVRFKNVDLDVELIGPGGRRTQVRTNDLSVRLDSEVRAKAISLASEFSFAKGSSVSLSEPGLTFEFDFATQGKLGFGLRQESGVWTYEIPASEWMFESQQLRLKTADSEMTLSKLLSSSHVQLLAQTSRLLKPEANALKSAKMKSETRIGRSTLSAGPRVVNVGDQKITVDSDLKERMLIHVAHFAKDLEVKPEVLRAFAVKNVIDLEVPRSLDSALIDLKTQVIDREILASKVEAKFNPTTEVLSGNGTCQVHLHPSLAEILRPAAALKKTGDIITQAAFTFTRQKSGDVEASIQTGIKDQKLPEVPGPVTANFDGVMKYSPSQSSVELEAKIDVVNRTYGTWRIAPQIAVKLPAGSSALSSNGQIEVLEVEPHQMKELPAHFKSPLQVIYKVDLSSGRNSADLQIKIKKIEAHGYASISDTLVTIAAASPDFAKAQSADVDVSVEQVGVKLDEKWLKLVPQIQTWTANVEGSLRNGRDLSIQKLDVEVEKLLSVKADATGDLATKALQSKVRVDLRYPEKLPALAGQNVKGQIEIPFDLSVARGKDISLDGNLVFKDLALSQGEIRLSGINGRMPFSERLVWLGDGFEFSELITQNPFERVDFERVRPLLQSSAPLKVAKISWEDREYGPLVGYFALKQNMALAHQFDLDFGKGRVYGELFVDALPSNLQVGSLSRVTSLDLTEVLPSRFLKRLPVAERKISARSGFVVNLNKSTMDGRIDVTEIGSAQLLALINVLDPNYEDEKFNKLRTALQLGAPTSVGLSFNEGFMNMDVGLSILGINQNQSLRGIPISSLLAKGTKEIVEQSQKGPLK